MANDVIGRVTSGSRKEYDVKWDDWKDVYVKNITDWGTGWQGVGKASSASEAMRKAEAYCYNK